jgi:hypothetical protein
MEILRMWITCKTMLKKKKSLAWWQSSVIQPLRKPQKDYNFEARVDYIARPVSNKQNKKEKRKVKNKRSYATRYHNLL